MYVLHHFWEDRHDRPVASDFYQHPYGGIGRDIWVSREAFARFFDHSPEYIDDLPVNMKLFNITGSLYEMLGYRQQDRIDGPISYRIVFIDRTHRAHYKYAQQEIRKAAA